MNVVTLCWQRFHKVAQIWFSVFTVTIKRAAAHTNFSQMSYTSFQSLLHPRTWQTESDGQWTVILWISISQHAHRMLMNESLYPLSCSALLWVQYVGQYSTGTGQRDHRGAQIQKGWMHFLLVANTTITTMINYLIVMLYPAGSGFLVFGPVLHLQQPLSFAGHIHLLEFEYALWFLSMSSLNYSDVILWVDRRFSIDYMVALAAAIVVMEESWFIHEFTMNF